MNGEEHNIEPHSWLHIRHSALDDEAIFDSEYGCIHAIEHIRVLATRLGTIEVAAFVILENEFQLLLKVAEDPTVLTRFMRLLTGHLTAHYNSHHRHKGSPWRPRFECSPVHETNVLTLMRYIEHRPVDVGLARCANQYRHSSFAVRLKDPTSHWMTDPESYLHLGTTREACLESYREHIKIRLSTGEMVMIESALTTRHRIAKPTPYTDENPQNQNKVADDDEPDNPKED